MPAMPPALLTLADAHYRAQAEEARRLATAVQSAWRDVPVTGLGEAWAWWTSTTPAVAERIRLGQAASATRGVQYVALTAEAQGARLDVPAPAPEAFISPAQDVEEWLRSPMAHLSALVLQGAPATTAKAIALSTLIRQASTLVADAGREATGVGIAANPDLGGYYRILRTPSCKRCAVLAGAFYGWNAGFRRHPVCDCQHVPAAGQYDDAAFDAHTAIERGQITGLTAAERAALDEGADLSRVINSSRSDTGLPRIHRGATPADIFRRANGSRSEARRLLARHGYLYEA